MLYVWQSFRSTTFGPTGTAYGWMGVACVQVTPRSTEEALKTANTFSPTASFSSCAAALVMMAVTVLPPRRPMRISLFTAPGVMPVIIPRQLVAGRESQALAAIHADHDG